MDDDDAVSTGVADALDEILEQYRFHWEPEYRLKLVKEISQFKLGVGLSKPHNNPARVRLTLKPPHHDHLHHDEASSSSSLSSSLSSSRRGWGVGLGRYVQKLLVLPQQRFAALYSRKLAWGILRFQFVAGYLWDKHRPSLDYRLSTKWNDGLRFKRKEYYQPHPNLMIRAKWNLDMQLPDVEGHIGGVEGATQVPMDVEYGSLDFSVTQLDLVCDLDVVGKRQGGSSNSSNSSSSRSSNNNSSGSSSSSSNSKGKQPTGVATGPGGVTPGSPVSATGGSGGAGGSAGSSRPSLPWGKF